MSLQDVTRQQAKKRAAARRLVAGQSTLDKYLSPASKAAVDKQVQKQMAKLSKAGTKTAGTCKLAAPAGKKRTANTEGQGGQQQAPKKPRRQMVRLYPDSPEPKSALQIRSPCRPSPVDGDDVDTEDADFQPVKKARRTDKQTKDLKAPRARKGHGRNAAPSQANTVDGSGAKQTASFQDYSLCTSKSKHGADDKSASAADLSPSVKDALHSSTVDSSTLM